MGDLQQCRRLKVEVMECSAVTNILNRVREKMNARYYLGSRINWILLEDDGKQSKVMNEE